jgi:raffinose/stachyose/melibiose transport system permease protein
MTRRLRATSLIWVLPALLLIFVFVYYPLVKNVQLSFYRWSAFTPSHWVGPDNYIKAVHDPVFWRALRNNIAYALVSVIVQVGGGLVLAALLEEFVVKRWRGLLRTIYFIPVTISFTVAGLLFSFIYNPQFGLLNQLLKVIGLPSLAHAWLGDPKTAIWSIIAMSQWQSTGYIAVLFTVALQRVPRDLYEAAAIDGASKVRSFFAVSVPMVREMTALMIIVTVTGAFLVFNEVTVMTAGGPNNASQVLGTWLYQNAFSQNDMGYASAIATIVFVITAIAALLQLAYTRRRTVEV